MSRRVEARRVSAQARQATSASGFLARCGPEDRNVIAPSHLDRHLAAGGDPGAHALAALHELRRLRVETDQELGELLAGLLADGAEVGALEDLPEPQDRGDDLVVVQRRS